MHMGRKLTVLWDEGELGNSVMLFTWFCCCYCPSQCALPTQCPIGHLVKPAFVVECCSLCCGEMNPIGQILSGWFIGPVTNTLMLFPTSAFIKIVLLSYKFYSILKILQYSNKCPPTGAKRARNLINFFEVYLVIREGHLNEADTYSNH